MGNKGEKKKGEEGGEKKNPDGMPSSIDAWRQFSVSDRK
jgi:hypothetical protein